jgi:hypothetical protein
MAREMTVQKGKKKTRQGYVAPHSSPFPTQKYQSVLTSKVPFIVQMPLEVPIPEVTTQPYPAYAMGHPTQNLFPESKCP